MLDPLAKASIVCWHRHVFWGEDGHVLRIVLYIEVVGQIMKRRFEKTWK